jgi:UPF0755 protein
MKGEKIMDQQNKTKKEYIREKMIEQQGEARVVRKVVMVTTLIFLVLVACVGIGGYLYVHSALKPVDPDNQTVKAVEIPIGSSVNSIASILEEEGIIKNARIFKYYIKLKNESGFQAGSYNLAPSMTLSDIVGSLKTGTVAQDAVLKMTIPEGKQLIQIADIIAEKISQDPEEIFEQLNNDDFVKKMQTKFPELLTDEIYQENVMYPLEGYLFPATYDFYEENPSLETIISQMLEKTEETLLPYRDEMEEKGYTYHTLLTFASLIEEEATEQVDRGMISSVFHNRLEVGMPLQTDPTVLYSKGQHQERVYYKDLEVESPYNTYQNKGLTPGPIANAGKTSIEAALKPSESEFLYFLATGTGEVLYSMTLDEHNAKKEEHITN